MMFFFMSPKPVFRIQEILNITIDNMRRSVVLMDQLAWCASMCQ